MHIHDSSEGDTNVIAQGAPRPRTPGQWFLFTTEFLAGFLAKQKGCLACRSAKWRAAIGMVSQGMRTFLLFCLLIRSALYSLFNGYRCAPVPPQAQCWVLSKNSVSPLAVGSSGRCLCGEVYALWVSSPQGSRGHNAGAEVLAQGYRFGFYTRRCFLTIRLTSTEQISLWGGKFSATAMTREETLKDTAREVLEFTSSKCEHFGDRPLSHSVWERVPHSVWHIAGVQ